MVLHGGASSEERRKAKRAPIQGKPGVKLPPGPVIAPRPAA